MITTKELRAEWRLRLEYNAYAEMPLRGKYALQLLDDIEELEAKVARFENPPPEKSISELVQHG